jgi:hypothetical protein
LSKFAATCVITALFIFVAEASAQERGDSWTEQGSEEKLETLRKQLEAQRDSIAAQNALIDTLIWNIEEIDKRIKDLIDAVRRDSLMIAEEEKRLSGLEDKHTPHPELPISDKADDKFPGSFGIPGTKARLRIGGFVKTVFAYNLDPIGSSDRFITALIPPAGTAPPSVDSSASFTANQSRLIVDFREPLKSSQLRAYVEGDFTGTSSTFHLRHAYGEYSILLVGQTWSVFTDILAVPEDVDFEGLNARTRLRQTQARVSPRLGQTYDLKMSLEDPNPEVTGGTAVSGIPDFAASVNKDVFLGHLRLSLLLRQIRARADTSIGGEISNTFGWGISFSGQIPTRDKDNFQYQLNFGRGIGRYINDLDEAGGQDAVYDPSTEDLTALGALGFYVSYQHWWSSKARSTAIYGFVSVDNLDIQDGFDYRRTHRLTGNLIWSPVQRIDLGGEVLWGERENKNLSKGNAWQIQLAAKYNF